MKNCVIVTLEELEMLLPLMGTQNLEGIVSITPGYKLKENLVDQIKEKGFVESGETGTSINEFVRFIFWTVAHANASFVMSSKNNECCNFYFYGDTIVFAEKKCDSDYYFFHWIPFITTAIGGLSEYFSFISDDGMHEMQTIIDQEEPTDYLSFRGTVEKHIGETMENMSKEMKLACFEGRENDKASFMAAMCCANDSYFLFQPTVLEPGENRHFGPGENSQNRPDKNRH